MAKHPSSRVGAVWLFSGCRTKDEDFLYGQELQSFRQDGTLTRLEVAFSRAGPSKVYVQHLLKQQVVALPFPPLPLASS